MGRRRTRTLVVQSHRDPLPYTWIESCLHSVQAWCDFNGFDYCFVGDELFEFVPKDIIGKFQQQRVIISDLARLKFLQSNLTNDYDTVVWLDADFLIFKKSSFHLPDSPYALGREVWIQKDKQGKLKSYRKIHNAFMMFRKDNTFLNFYTETAERLLRQATDRVPPQFVGPKWLSALHNIAMLPVLETAGMLSPEVILNLLNGEGEALQLFLKKSTEVPVAANLCISSCVRQEVREEEMIRLIDTLLTKGIE